MKLKLSSILLFYTICCFGQTSLSNVGGVVSDHLLHKEVNFMNRNNGEPIEGTPYLQDSFTKADIYTTSGIYRQVPARFHILADYLEYIENGITYILDPSIQLRRIVWSNYELVLQPYEDLGKVKMGFFIPLDTSGILLLKKKIVRLEGKQLAKALESHSTPAKYHPMPDRFYYRVHNFAAKPISSIKKMVEDFPDNQKSLISEINRKHLRSNEKDLLELWEYYHSINYNKN